MNRNNEEKDKQIKDRNSINQFNNNLLKDELSKKAQVSAITKLR